MGDETRINAPTKPLDRVTREFYGKALIWCSYDKWIWCSYDKWTVEETANLLCGCIPDRKMFGLGERNRRLDEAVVAVENRLLADVSRGELTAVRAKRYFGKTFIKRADVLPWAKREGIDVPAELIQAMSARERRKDPTGRYMTPYLDAIFWIIREFWQGHDLPDAPSPEEVVQAVRAEFRELSEPEARMLDRVTRHPDARML